MEEIKITKKMIDKEKNRMSKKEKKAAADANWVGKGTMRPPVVFGSRKKETRRPNIEHLYRSGKLD